MEYGKAFTFFRDDEKGITKLLIGGVMNYLGFVIVPIFALWGYSFEILQNVAAGSTQPMPEWDEFGDKFRKGLNVFAIRFVYFLPIVIVFCCFFILSFGLGLATGSSTQGGSSNATTASSLASILSLCLACVAFIYGLVATVASDAALILYASSGELNTAFKFSEVLAFTQRHVADLVITLVVTFAAGVVGGLASIITCGLGAPFVSAWVEFAKSNLLGQISQKAGLPSAPSKGIPPAAPSSPPPAAAGTPPPPPCRALTSPASLEGQVRWNLALRVL